MYLNLLNENEKKQFVNLAYNLASADGDYSEAEKILVQSYCQEMNIVFDENSNIEDTENILLSFQNHSNEQIKRIVIFELVGLVMVDGKYDETEKAIINKIENKFGIERGYSDKCEKVITEYISFQEKINELVIG